MIVLVSNIGTTSFKFKLFDMSKNELVLAEGAADRIGQGNSAWKLNAECGMRNAEGVADLKDHGEAIGLLLGELTKAGVISSIDQVEAIGFKAVHGGGRCRW